MLTLDVKPDRSVGCTEWEFIVGMHFSQAVAIIQSQVGIMKGVHVLYNHDEALDVDIVIELPQDGIRLYFDPISQRLKIIDIYIMKNVKLKYCSLFFNSPEVLPTLEQIEHSFGATLPGEYDAEKQLYVMNFRGVAFHFPVVSKFQTGNNHELGSLQFPSGCTPVASRMLVYIGNGICSKSAPEMPLECYYGHIYLKSAVIIRGPHHTKGVKVKLMAATNHRTNPTQIMFEKQILLGDSTQDIASALGCPSKVFYKSDDKMQIHTANKSSIENPQKSDYFFNYFTLGMDVLFDARTHLVKKLVLHTNYPGHYNFNMYMRCEFSLRLNNTDVNAYSRWDDLKKHFAHIQRPIVLHRSGSTNTTNPFGGTQCYGYEDIIFEIMPNDFIASLSIFGNGSPYKMTQQLA
ncbi:hypothetical protein WA026_013300 [Henosepilachna vigintioctopunctata]|uniref:Uncharacterized protein n=1 Tax=Henosepilachna vigintioctopunctata TaxID=420089 RepID=A0AAW1VDT1_9CUCU